MSIAAIGMSRREIAHRTRGRTHGPITRLVSPSDLGRVMKPFVFLDHAVFDAHSTRPPMARLWHPHSGIATVTVVLDGTIRYAETTGKSGELAPGGIEWMRAGGGVWHTGEAGAGDVRVFQLWVALPPHLENGPNASHYVKPDEVPVRGPARIVLGEYLGAKSPIDAPEMTYLAVTLKPGERWQYVPPTHHDVAWVAVDRGNLVATTAIGPGEIAVFEESSAPLDFVAEGETRVVLGSATKHPYDLVLGSYSVHTTSSALRQGEAEIQRIGRQLAAR
jgi:redox-sensitive bicupin YhaK (pirin superfamily)